MKKTLYIILFLLGFSTYTFSQDFLMGLQYGAGNQTFKRSSDDQKTAEYFTQKVGLMLEFSPYYSLLFLTTGAEYVMNDLATEVSIPLSFKVAPGKKIRPFGEIGVYYNYVLSDIADNYLVKNDFGSFARVGLFLNIKKKFDVELSYSYNYGLTTSLEEEILLPIDQIVVEEYKHRLQGLSLRLKYRLY